MMSRLNTNTNTSSEDFPYSTTMSYVGLESGMNQRPAQHHLYDNLDFAAAAAAFQFQECPPPPLFSMPTNLPSISPPMPMPLPMPMPVMPEYPLGQLVKREGAAHAIGVGANVGIGIGSARLGLNLGRRTYFSPGDVLAVDRLLMRARLGSVFGFGFRAHQPPRCQAEGCKADLSAAKHYHRRHKVCEYHAKAAVIVAGGKQQRFCQQCSRFHVLAEFDDAKRSCRKRLAEHNRRRRKPTHAQTSILAKDSPPSKKAATTSTTTTSSYTADKAMSATKSTISSNGSSVSCLEGAGYYCQNKAKPTLSLGAVQEKLQGHQEHFASLVQHSNNNNSNILSSSSASASSAILQSNGDVSEQNNSGNLHLFEVDLIM